MNALQQQVSIVFRDKSKSRSASMSSELFKTFQAKLSSNLSRTREQDKLTDVKFIIGQDEKEFNANRLILAAASDVFKAMFYGNMKESEPNSTVTIPDVSSHAFGAMLDFVYFNDPKLNADNIVSVSRVADKYQITPLIQYCQRCLPLYLTKSNFCALLNDFCVMELNGCVEVCRQQYFERKAIQISWLLQNIGCSRPIQARITIWLHC